MREQNGGNANHQPKRDGILCRKCSCGPTNAPTTYAPTSSPTPSPTASPTDAPTTASPTAEPTESPTAFIGCSAFGNPYDCNEHEQCEFREGACQDDTIPCALTAFYSSASDCTGCESSPINFFEYYDVEAYACGSTPEAAEINAKVVACQETQMQCHEAIKTVRTFAHLKKMPVSLWVKQTPPTDFPTAPPTSFPRCATHTGSPTDAPTTRANWSTNRYLRAIQSRQMHLAITMGSAKWTGSECVDELCSFGSNGGGNDCASVGNNCTQLCNQKGDDCVYNNQDDMQNVLSNKLADNCRADNRLSRALLQQALPGLSRTSPTAGYPTDEPTVLDCLQFDNPFDCFDNDCEFCAGSCHHFNCPENYNQYSSSFCGDSCPSYYSNHPGFQAYTCGTTEVCTTQNMYLACRYDLDSSNLRTSSQCSQLDFCGIQRQPLQSPVLLHVFSHVLSTSFPTSSPRLFPSSPTGSPTTSSPTDGPMTPNNPTSSPRTVPRLLYTEDPSCTASAGLIAAGVVVFVIVFCAIVSRRRGGESN